MRAESNVLDAVSRTVSPLRYRLYGLAVASELPLPIAAVDDVCSPDLTIRCISATSRRAVPGEPWVATLSCEVHGAAQALRYAGPSGSWLINRPAMFWIAPDGSEIEVLINPGAEEREVTLLLLGQAIIFALRAQGRIVLHASAVAVEGQGIAFVGEPGAGKSSMAAGFLDRGAALLTDDALRMEMHAGSAIGHPSFGLMKLWPEAAIGALGVTDDLPPLLDAFDKRLLRLDRRFLMIAEPQPITALYALERYELDSGDEPAVTFRTLSGPEAMALLIAQTSWLPLVQPAEVAASLPAYSRLSKIVALRAVRYPSGFAHRAAVQAAILRDMNGL